jgi:hypothetical protein
MVSGGETEPLGPLQILLVAVAIYYENCKGLGFTWEYC